MKLTPTKILIALFLIFIVASGMSLAADNKLNIIVFGAHPDDPEKLDGIMLKFIQHGHNVCLVSLTNGNAGHHEMGGGPLAQRRYKEARCAEDVIGAEYIVCDVDDGKLMPPMENREMIIRLIREWNADIVISHRPNDYHPDHRNTGLLVRDAAYMVTVPNIVPNTPHLRKNPVFKYSPDRFPVPTPFIPDIVVAVDDVMKEKIDMYHCHTSQMYEWLPYNQGGLG
ncbi:MAG: PIG-L family deacetylase [Acidobacteriota bacterium]